MVSNLGINVTRYSRVYDGRGPLREEFLKSVSNDLINRGFSFARGPDRETLVYEDFWNKVEIRASGEDMDLRYLFTIEMSQGSLVAMAIGILLIIIGAILVGVVWYIKLSSLKSSLIAAGETAARTIHPIPPPPVHS